MDRSSLGLKPTLSTPTRRHQYIHHGTSSTWPLRLHIPIMVSTRCQDLEQPVTFLPPKRRGNLTQASSTLHLLPTTHQHIPPHPLQLLREMWVSAKLRGKRSILTRHMMGSLILPYFLCILKQVQDPSNDWDDKDGHFIVHVGKEFTGRCMCLPKAMDHLYLCGGNSKRLYHALSLIPASPFLQTRLSNCWVKEHSARLLNARIWRREIDVRSRSFELCKSTVTQARLRPVFWARWSNMTLGMSSKLSALWSIWNARICYLLTADVYTNCLFSSFSFPKKKQ